MKIDRPGSSQSVSSSRKTPKRTAGQASFTPDVDGSEPTQHSGPIAATGPVASVDALLALQEAPGDTEAGSRSFNRAKSLLDLLEDVHHGLVLGQIPADRLHRLAAMARQKRDGYVDERLSDLLDEIEIRAEVELAKLEMSGLDIS